MNISRSGYYKWLRNKDIKNIYQINRELIEDMAKQIHKKKPSYGYHRIHSKIFELTG